jgi:hypothetical protein
MRFGSTTLFSACLAGSALASAALLTPAWAAGIGPLYTTADVVGTVSDASKVDFHVYLPLRNKDALETLLARQQDRSSTSYHHWLTPAQFGTQFGPDSATIEAVTRELAGHGFTVTPGVRSLHVIGTAQMVNAAFGTRLRLVSLDGLKLTPALASAGARVTGFSPRRFELHPESHKLASNPDVVVGERQSFWFDELKEAYAYPASNATVTAFDGTKKLLNGSGTTIAALMSSDMLDSDIGLMFEHEQYSEISHQPLPIVQHVYVDGATPGVLTGAFDEASLDTQMETGGAPGASVILYDIPDLSDNSTLAGYTEIDDSDVADVVSSSFGGCELLYTAAYNGGVDYTYYFEYYHELFEQGNAEGITFLASSGDESGRACPTFSYFTGRPANFIPSVSTPAADTDVTAVGGGNLMAQVTSGAENSHYKSENAYSDPEIPYDPYGLGTGVTGGSWGAGGGVSVYFAQPSYQTLVHTTTNMRVLPDVGMEVGGCPGGIAQLPCDGGDLAINGNGNSFRSSVYVYIEGSIGGFIGTSVASPEFASAVALLVELKGRQGNLNTYLYTAGHTQFTSGGTIAPSFHTGVPGYNTVHPNSFPAADYNYTMGLGSPYVATLMGVPAGTRLAGTPQTPSNP